MVNNTIKKGAGRPRKNKTAIVSPTSRVLNEDSNSKIDKRNAQSKPSISKSQSTKKHTPKSSLNKQDKADRDELYRYYKDIMGYPQNAKMSPGVARELFQMAYNNAEYVYGFKCLYYTFVSCEPKIKLALASKEFPNELVKFHYIKKIVEDKLNDMYAKLRDRENSKEQEKVIDKQVEEDLDRYNQIKDQDNNTIKSNDNQVEYDELMEKYKDLW